MMRCLLLLAAAMPLTASALEFKTLEVSRSASVYHVIVDVLLDAPPERVRAQLLDAKALPRLDPSITAVRSSNTATGLRVESDLQECLFGFCRKMLHVQEVQSHGNEITAQTLLAPGSSFKSGIAHWQLTPEGLDTRLLFTADIEPDLWLPPVIGPRHLMHQLEAKTRASLQALEQLAHE